MTLRRWEPIRELALLQNAMDRLFDDSIVRLPAVWSGRTEPDLMTIPIDMRETGEHLVVRADLPGLKPAEVEISVTGNLLTLRGEFRAEEEGEAGTVYFRERRFGRFERSLVLPPTVNADQAEAEFAEGVLTVTLPKTEGAKPKRVAIKAQT
jgi:HSP20 family protein